MYEHTPDSGLFTLGVDYKYLTCRVQQPTTVHSAQCQREPFQHCKVQSVHHTTTNSRIDLRLHCHSATQ